MRAAAEKSSRVVRVVVTLLLVNLLANTSAAAGQSTENGPPASTEVSPADEALGARLHVQAMVALRESRLLDAASLIRESLAAHTWSRPIFTHAQILEAMGRPLDAVKLYAQLANNPGLVEEDARNIVIDAMTRAQALVAHVEITWGVADRAVVVRVDGEPTESAEGTTLLVPVNPGEHLVRVECRGRTPFERHLRLEPGERALIAVAWSHTPSDEIGRVLIRSDATITVGSETAEGELALELPAGEHTVVLRNEHGRDEESIWVRTGQLTRFELTPPRPRRRGWLWALGAALIVGAGAAAAIALTRSPSTPQLPIDDLGT